MKITPKDYIEELLSEYAVRDLLGLSTDHIGLETNIPIGREYAEVFVVPCGRTAFAVEVDSLSKDIVIFTWVMKDHTRVLGWWRREQVVSRPRDPNGKIMLSIGELEPFESLMALAVLRTANQEPTGEAGQRPAVSPQPHGSVVGQDTSNVESGRSVIYSGSSGSAARFPVMDAPKETCRQFVTLACRALSSAMLGRLLSRDGALLWVTRYADGTVTAEASDIFAEPEVADQLSAKPGPGEVLVVLAYADVQWDDSASCAGKVGFFQALLSPKQPAIQ